MSIYTATTEGEEALAAATKETLIQLRGATTTRAKIVAWGVSFDGISPTAEPVLVEFELQTTDGTGTGATEQPIDLLEPSTALCAALHSFSAQPTSGVVLEQYVVHPQGGLLIREYPPGREPVLDKAATSRIGIAVTAPATVNATAWIQWDE